MSDERRQLKHEVYMRMAQQLARLSTCRRLSVGAVLLRRDGSVAGVGYNGALPGQPHCAPEICNASARCFNTRHAERSALDYSTGEVAAAYVPTCGDSTRRRRFTTRAASTCSCSGRASSGMAMSLRCWLVSRRSTASAATRSFQYSPTSSKAFGTPLTLCAAILDARSLTRGSATTVT